jgi:hypothetical protein
MHGKMRYVRPNQSCAPAVEMTTFVAIGPGAQLERYLCRSMNITRSVTTTPITKPKVTKPRRVERNPLPGPDRPSAIAFFSGDGPTAPRCGVSWLTDR